MTVQLPWVKELLSPTTPDQMGLPQYFSALVPGGAYKLSSSAPVNAYQFNPLEFQTKPNCAPGDRACFTFSNDASLLLPTSTMTGHYIVISRPTWKMNDSVDYGFGGQPVLYKFVSPGFFTIVGAEYVPDPMNKDEELGQNVSILFKAPTLASNGGTVKSYRGGETGMFNLKHGDVLQIMSGAPSDCMVLPGDKEMTTDENGYDHTRSYCDLGEAYDLTGTEIESDHKLAVFGGHNCTFVPYNKWACDHLEEALLPLEGWGKQYIGSHSQRQPTSIPDLWRVVSGADGNMITFDPPSAHDPVMLDRGRWIEFSSKGDFVANGTGAFALAQYPVGQNYVPNAGSSPGDPDMSIAVPTEQYRSNYTFLTPATYTLNYVNITAPATKDMDGNTVLASPITLDGEDVWEKYSAKFKGIGSEQYMAARILLEKDGAHTISSGKPFGIVVYGLASYTSYMYPGGLDVKQINVQ